MRILAISAVVAGSVVTDAVASGPPRLYTFLNNVGSAVSGDGQVAGIGSNIWSEGTGLRPLPTVPGSTSQFIDDLSFTGAVAAGTAVRGSQSWQWSPVRFQGTTFQDLGTIPGYNGGEGVGVSADGRTIVGTATSSFMGHRAFRWTAETGMQSLGVFPNGISSYADGVSGDGRVVVGGAHDPAVGTVGFRWTQSTGLVSLGVVPGQEFSAANAASFDGSVIVGTSRLLNGTYVGTRWTASTGITRLPSLPGYRDINVKDTSADGQFSVGLAETPGGANQSAVVWTPQGIRSLASILTERGVSFGGFQFRVADAISDDGSVIVGSGRLNGDSYGFVAILPSPGAVTVVSSLLLFTARRRNSER